MSASYSTRSAARRRAIALRVSSAGSPGPAPTSDTWPRWAGLQSCATAEARLRLRPGEVLTLWAAVSLEPEAFRPAYSAFSAWSSLGLRAAIGTPSRRQIARWRRASAIHRSRSAGRTASSASRSSAVSAGASPLVDTAIVTPSRRTVPLRNALALAGSSTALTKIRRASAAAATSRLTSGVAAATTSQAPSRSVGHEGAPRNLDAGTLDVRRDLGRDDPHAGARVDERLQLGGGHRSASDEHDVPSGERQKEWKQVTHKSKKPGKPWASRAVVASAGG